MVCSSEEIWTAKGKFSLYCPNHVSFGCFRLFEDVGPALQQIVDEGINVYVYSSGSIESQKLLFGNTEEGDLLEVIIWVNYWGPFRLRKPVEQN